MVISSPTLLRTRLVLIGLLLLGLIMLMGGMAYWAAGQFHHQLARSQLAHGVQAEYLRLAGQLHPLVHQMWQEAGGDGGAEGASATQLRREMRATLDRIRALVAREVVHTGNVEHDDEELAMLAAIERQIEATLRRAETAADLKRTGRMAEARALLGDIHDTDIHGRFNARLDAALAREKQEVTLSDQTSLAVLRTLVAVAAASLVAALLLAAGALLHLRNQLGAPLERLLQGTRAVAEGNLAYRMPVRGRDEFARIATDFNSMAEALERSHVQATRSQQELERRVAERTEQLREVNETLARIDRSRRELFADISHELRTPLTVIRGESQFALKGEDKNAETYKDALGRILEQSSQLGRLVDDLLFIARADSGSVRLRRTTVPLRHLLTETCADAGVLARHRGHVILFPEPGDEIVVSGDPTRLRQLFMILLDNAARYSPPGSEIKVGLRADASGDGVVVSVGDQGIGIAPGEVALVFERFYRGDRASALDDQGLGLGLPMAKAIVQAHGGEIAIESQIERGSVVSVTLPLTEQPQGAS